MDITLIPDTDEFVSKLTNEQVLFLATQLAALKPGNALTQKLQQVATDLAADPGLVMSTVNHYYKASAQ